MAPATELGHSAWNATSTTTRPRSAARLSGRSVLNHVCTVSSGAWTDAPVMIHCTLGTAHLRFPSRPGAGLRSAGDGQLRRPAVARRNGGSIPGVHRCLVYGELLQQILERLRLAHGKALPIVDAQVHHSRPQYIGLDVFGDGFHAHDLRQLRD